MWIVLILWIVFELCMISKLSIIKSTKFRGAVDWLLTIEKDWRDSNNEFSEFYNKHILAQNQKQDCTHSRDCSSMHATISTNLIRKLKTFYKNKTHSRWMLHLKQVDQTKQGSWCVCFGGGGASEVTSDWESLAQKELVSKGNCDHGNMEILSMQ